MTMEAGRNKMPRDLIGIIIDTICDEIPINLVCPYCERTFEVDNVIDPSAKRDRQRWEKLAQHLIDAVKDEIADRAGDAIAKISL